MSAATSPTKTAATHSIISMKRSMRLRTARPFGFYPSPSSGRAGWGASTSSVPGERPHPTLPEDGEGEATSRRTPNLGPASIPRVMLRKLVLELLHGGGRIDADLADIVGPALLQRLGRLLPLRQLIVREPVHVMARLGFHLGDALVL